MRSSRRRCLMLPGDWPAGLRSPLTARPEAMSELSAAGFQALALWWFHCNVTATSYASCEAENPAGTVALTQTPGRPRLMCHAGEWPHHCLKDWSSVLDRRSGAQYRRIRAETMAYGAVNAIGESGAGEGGVTGPYAGRVIRRVASFAPQRQRPLT
jgi:hypothetical protein